jgi:hypothetical protein
MTDGTSNVVHVVRDVYVTSASIATGEVRGTADPGAALQVEAPTPAGRVLEPVVADSSGNWVAGPFDLLPGSWGHVWQHDTVNNSTDVLWFPTLVFGGHYYEVIDEPATWHNAAAYCEQDGGYLATINSAEENQFVYNLTDIGNQTWLGATDEAVEGTWKWVTGEPFDYTNWGLGEPNNNAPGPDPDLGEDYLTFHGEGAYDPPQPGVWNDWQYETDGSESTLPFVCESEERQVDVDIKPGSDTNPINLKSKGVIPVAIVTTDDFDATTVDPLSVRFGPAEATEAHERGHLEDVDGDGDIDLMLHFRTQETGIQPGDTEACLIGETFNGDALRGCDSIMVKGGKRR